MTVERPVEDYVSSRTRVSADGRKLMPWLLAGVVFISVGILGYLFLAKLQTIDKGMEEVSEQLGDISQRLEQINEKAEVAKSIAIQAGDDAQLAARGRAIAEASRNAFEERAMQAEQDAAKAQQEVQMARDEIERIRRERDAEMNRLQAALNKIADTRRTALGLVMNLGSDRIRFDFDKAELRMENKELLSRIAGVLLTSRGYRVQIYGYTDDVGTAEYNLDLSRRRAEVVRNYFVKVGIDPTILSTKGFGKSNPLVPGTTPRARAKNRRVEVGIIDTVIKYDRPLDSDESNDPAGH